MRRGWSGSRWALFSDGPLLWSPAHILVHVTSSGSVNGLHTCFTPFTFKLRVRKVRVCRHRSDHRHRALLQSIIITHFTWVLRPLLMAGNWLLNKHKSVTHSRLHISYVDTSSIPQMAFGERSNLPTKTRIQTPSGTKGPGVPSHGNHSLIRVSL